MRITIIFPLLLLISFSITGNITKSPRDRTILAIFAHPDDELMVSPILSKYVRQGVHVYIAIATSGKALHPLHTFLPVIHWAK
jgi:hypothetical protein